MTDRELQKLSRKELLELLVVQKREIEQLEKSLEMTKAQLESRQIKLNEAGSIAQASLELNGVFEAAQQAADQYLLNVKHSEERCQKIQEEAEQKANQLLYLAQKKAEEMEAEAKYQADQYWQDVSKRLENFYEEHAGLRELLNVVNSKG